MNWTLFARLEHTVSRARHLDPERDAEPFATLLRERVPELFTTLDEGTAKSAALHMAKAALQLLGQLPREIDETAASLVDATPSAPNEALAKTAALAYVACSNDLLPDELPAGYGLLDDALLLRVAEVGPASTWAYDSRLQQLGAEARFLSLFLPRELLPAVGDALDDLFRTIATYHRFPLFVLKEATRKLIEEPPSDVAELMPVPAHADAGPVARPPLFTLTPARLHVDEHARLRFAFADGVELTLADGNLAVTS